MPATTAIPGRKPGGTAAAGPKLIERQIVDLTFVAAPSVARKVLNQIASSTQQFYIIRTLHMRTLDLRNEKETAKGPPREPTSQNRERPPFARYYQLPVCSCGLAASGILYHSQPIRTCSLRLENFA